MISSPPGWQISKLRYVPCNNRQDLVTEQQNVTTDIFIYLICPGVSFMMVNTGRDSCLN